MRIARVCFASLLVMPFVALLSGCGSSASPGVAAVPNSYAFSGEWGAQLAPGVSLASTPIESFLGTLSSSNGIVTGSLIALPNGAITGLPCTTPSLLPIAVSGTVDSSGNLIITLPVGGGTATLTTTLSTNVESEAAGSFKIVGGNCAMPPTAMQIAQYAPINGTYTGTFTELNLPGQPVTTTTITAVLVQSTTSNANDQYPVTGMVTVTGACSASFTLSNSIAWGGILEASGSPINDILAAGSDPSGTTLDGLFSSENSTTACPFNSSQPFLGVLTRQ